MILPAEFEGWVQAQHQEDEDDSGQATDPPRVRVWCGTSLPELVRVRDGTASQAGVIRLDQH